MPGVTTDEQVTIFPRPLGRKLLLGNGVIAVGSLAIVPFAWRDQDYAMAWLALGFGVAILCLVAFMIRHRARGTPIPTLMLSPEGLHLLTGTKGVIPWGRVNGLGSYASRHMRGLVINVDKDALAALEQSAVFKASRKFDAAIGVHALIILEAQSEVPLHDLADMIHDYSIAHGGPPLQPNRHP